MSDRRTIRTEDGYSKNLSGRISRHTWGWVPVSLRGICRTIVPERIRNQALTISIQPMQSELYPREPLSVEIRMENKLPIPVDIETRSPIAWKWAVNGWVDADRYSKVSPDQDSRYLSFDGNEQKRYSRTWHQLVRISKREWAHVNPGTHELACWINVENPVQRGLYSETTVEILASEDDPSSNRLKTNFEDQ